MKYKAIGIISCIAMLLTLLEPIILYISLGYERSMSSGALILGLISILVSSVLLAAFMSLNVMVAPK